MYKSILLDRGKRSDGMAYLFRKIDSSLRSELRITNFDTKTPFSVLLQQEIRIKQIQCFVRIQFHADTMKSSEVYMTTPQHSNSKHNIDLY